MTHELTKERKRFEAWAESMPDERDTSRYNSDDPWPDLYRDPSVQLAWESWLEALEITDMRLG